MLYLPFIPKVRANIHKIKNYYRFVYSNRTKHKVSFTKFVFPPLLLLCDWSYNVRVETSSPKNNYKTVRHGFSAKSTNHSARELSGTGRKPKGVSLERDCGYRTVSPIPRYINAKQRGV